MPKKKKSKPTGTAYDLWWTKRKEWAKLTSEFEAMNMKEEIDMNGSENESKPTGNVETETIKKISELILDSYRKVSESVGEPSEIKRKKLEENISIALAKVRSIPVAFPQCTDVLLSHINTSKGIKSEEEVGDTIKVGETIYDIDRFFVEYFHFEPHNIFGEDTRRIEREINKTLRDPKYSDCWPAKGCLPPSCVTLKGDRCLVPKKDQPTDSNYNIKRLFIGDLVWLFYFERMGIFKILGIILDDFATKGKYPLDSDDISAIILEAMIRQTKMGLNSTVRDRNSSYRRVLGWNSEAGSRLSMDTVVNTAFNTLFHRFIQNSLEYYKWKRLSDVINKAAPPSVATLNTISDTIELLKKAFKPFEYGRNHYNTLSGIVWVIAAADLLSRVKSNLGIPQNYTSPHEFIPAAYDILVLGRSVTSSESNRYIIHKECAEYARCILLDLEVVNYRDASKDGELETWLDIVENKIEGYRTSYRLLTGVDLGIPPAPGTPKIEQQA